MTPAEIAALKERAAKFYITAHDSPDIVKLCNYALTLAEQALRLRELMIEDAVAECTLCGRHPEFLKKSDCRECAAAVNDRIRAALAQAHGDGE